MDCPPAVSQPTPTPPTPGPLVANATAVEPTAQRAHTTDTTVSADFAALLAAAGIEGAAVTPEVIEQFGRILRIVVSGTMDLLRVREGVKDEFRMKMTTFKASDNNPLKFSANVEDALHNLLVKRNAAYLPPVEAFRDAFQDARNHQVAMFEGLRAAFAAMLHDFDPQVLEEQFEKQSRGSLLSGRRKYWDLYGEWYAILGQDADSAFRSLFGEEFAKAYEQQMQRLKNGGRPPS
jgi:type VI secretion system FHA domain protein